jgi:hypothetical protein
MDEPSVTEEMIEMIFHKLSAEDLINWDLNPNTPEDMERIQQELGELLWEIIYRRLF